jgi:hypothetical protein
MEQEISTQEALQNAEKVITVIRQQKPELQENCNLVGYWIWFESAEKPNQETIDFLKSLGFKWNKARNCWQNCCGLLRRRSTSNPKDKYSVKSLKDLKFRLAIEPDFESAR